jgi:hypothetical protein
MIFKFFGGLTVKTYSDRLRNIMSVNAETLANMLQELGYPPESVDIARDAAARLKAIEEAQGFPSSVELEEAEAKAELGDLETKLGLEAREIAMMPEFHLRGGNQRVDFGDVRTRFGGVLSVCSYDIEGEDLLVGEKGRLAIVIRKPGMDPELRKVMKIGPLGLLGEKRAVELNTNLRSDFGTVDVPKVDKMLGRLSVSPDNDVRVGSKEDTELATLLVSRVLGSRQFIVLQRERVTQASVTR